MFLKFLVQKKDMYRQKFSKVYTNDFFSFCLGDFLF